MRQHSLARSLTTASLATLLGLAAQPSFAAADHAHAPAAITAPNAKAAEARQKAYDHTQALMALQKRWANAKGAEKSRALEQLVAKAEERRAFLLELMERNPAEVLRVAIPEEKQMGMPAEVLDKLEQRLETEGELEAIFEDYEDGSHKLRHFVNTPFGERFELYLAPDHSHLKHGQRVHISGWTLTVTNSSMHSTEALVSQDLYIQEMAYDGMLAAPGDITPQLTHTLGEQRTLMMLLNFSDNTSEPWTTSEAQSMLFETVNQFIQENSGGRTWLTGDVVGWNTLSVSSSVCDNLSIYREALSIAAAQNINTASYNRILFAFPKNACGYSGSGTVGGMPSYSYINGSLTLRTLAHELGHNFGLFHAHSLECGSTTEGENCKVNGYGDTLDVMGYYDRVGHFNGFNKELLGWLSEQEVATVSTSGQYQLAPYISGKSQPKVIKVLRDSDAVNGNSWYYLEMRQPEGEDSQLFDGSKVDASNVMKGVILHSAVEGDADTSKLLDMTPSSASASYDDWEDPALVSGAFFQSTNEVLDITTIWADETGATVEINIDGSNFPCTLKAPVLSTPGESTLWGSAGSTQTYQLTLSNPGSCDLAKVSMSAELPQGWTSDFGQHTLSLASGESIDIFLALTSDTSASTGFYDINLGVVENDSLKESSTVITYVVEEDATTGGGNTPPNAKDDLITLESKNEITFSVLSNDIDADGDALTINAISKAAKGGVTLNPDGTLTYVPARKFKDTDSFTYTVTDGEATATAQVLISLSSTGNDSGNDGKGSGKNKP